MALIINQFRGLIPSLSRQQVQEPFVIDGKNFIFATQGPRTAFGSDIYIYERLYRPRYIQSIKVGQEYFLFTDNGILIIDSANNRYAPFYHLPINQTYFPWSIAFVANRYYFAKKNSPLLQYNPLTGSIIVMDDPNIPANPVAVTQSGGRLIILGIAAIAWSAIDDGEDLAPDAEGTGAGFQLTAIAGGGNPLAAKEVVGGFITYLENGILFSRLIDAAIPFHHTVISSETVPLNPFCIADISKQNHIVLSRIGFFSVLNITPEPWQPLMSEHFKETIFKNVNTNIDENYRLFYDTKRQLLFISWRQGAEIFDKSFVIYIPRDEFGSFDYLHYSLMNFPPHISTIAEDDLVYLDHDRYARKITEFGNFEIFSRRANLYAQRGITDEHSAYFDGVTNNFSTVIKISTIDFSREVLPNNTIYNLNKEIETVDDDLEIVKLYTFIESNQQSTDGLFFSDGFGSFDQAAFETAVGMLAGFSTYQVIQHLREYAFVDSFVELGVFRLQDPQAVGRYHAQTLIAINSSDQVSEQTFIDWLTIEGDDINEDWNILDEEEDWGEGVTTGSRFFVELHASNDAYNLINQDGGLFKTTELIPIIVDGRRTLYTTYENALYLSLKIKTKDPGDYFEIKQIEMETPVAGRQS